MGALQPWKNSKREAGIMKKNDPYRDLSPSDRREAWKNGDYESCRRYDRDFESSQRAYENWISGGVFRDYEPDERFS